MIEIDVNDIINEEPTTEAPKKVDCRRDKNGTSAMNVKKARKTKLEKLKQIQVINEQQLQTIDDDSSNGSFSDNNNILILK
jgi:hypothetical protein